MPTEMSIGISRLLDSYSEHPAEARVEEALTAKRMRSVTASDTLFEIAARVDDETLLALYPAHREQISWLISDNNWWYIRTQHLVGQRLINRQANWSRIYYALDHEVLGSDFDYLPSVLVYEELHGPHNEDWSEETERAVWKLVADPDVLEYFISTGQLHPLKVTGIENAVKKGWVSMVEPLYRLMKALANVGHSLVSKLSNLFKIAVENHNRDIAVILVRLALEYRDVFLYNVRYEMLQAALQSGDVGLLLLLRPMWKEQHEFRLSINYDLNQADPAMIQLLYDANLVNPGRDMLKRALANREGERPRILG